jgi:hypothetical protein
MMVASAAIAKTSAIEPSAALVVNLLEKGVRGDAQTGEHQADGQDFTQPRRNLEHSESGWSEVAGVNRQGNEAGCLEQHGAGAVNHRVFEESVRAHESSVLCNSWPVQKAVDFPVNRRPARRLARRETGSGPSRN